MKIELWGTRGSAPTPSGTRPDGVVRETHRYGGNTTSFGIVGEDGTRTIVDAGSGIIGQGQYIMKDDKPVRIDVLISHTHWDHIQGIPFFGPAYDERSHVAVFGEAKVKYDLGDTVEGHSEHDRNNGHQPQVMTIEASGIKEVLSVQQEYRNFPVGLGYLKGLKSFYDFVPGAMLGRGDTRIETFSTNHPGGCTGFKFISPSGKTAVMTSDFEPDNGPYDATLRRVLQGADLWIADGQYEMGSKINPFKEKWGHSDPFWDTEMALDAGVKRLVVVHHEPKMDDPYHADLEKRVQHYALDRLASKNRRPNDLYVELGKEGSVYTL